jgi:hypothetical protein
MTIWLVKNRKGIITTQLTRGVEAIRPPWKTEYLWDNVLNLEQLCEHCARFEL